MSVPRCPYALLIGLVLSAASSLAATPVEEKQEPSAAPLPSDSPDRSLKLNHLVSAGYNPLGTEYRTRVGYWLRQSQSEEFLWRRTYLSLGGQVRISPTNAAVGPLVEWQPLSVFNLRALVEAVGFYGLFGQLLSYRSALDEYSDELRKRQAASAYGTTGWHAMLQPTLRAQLGPVIVQSVTTLDYQDMRLSNGDSVWYEAGRDSLIPNRGWSLTEEVRLVYVADPLTFGPLFRYVLPLYSPEHFRPGEQASAALNANMRLGLLATYTFIKAEAPYFYRPSLSLNVQWHLRHRYRTGAETSQAIPFVGLNFSFQQDFVL